MQSSEQIDSFEITLATPENIGGQKFEKLTFRKPLGADMERFLGQMIEGGGVSMGKAITGLAAATVVSHPLSEDDFRSMNAKNYMLVAMEFSRFLL